MLSTRFRRSLVSRSDAAKALPPHATRLDQLAFYGDLHSDAEIDLETDCAQDFINALTTKAHCPDSLQPARDVITASAASGTPTPVEVAS